MGAGQIRYRIHRGNQAEGERDADRDLAGAGEARRCLLQLVHGEHGRGARKSEHERANRLGGQRPGQRAEASRW
jgi:hypothetical protein